ncbi:protein of unknown function DUF134 [Chloroherpeton thalassium ATCC 35110]|uniref:UPF0251 protein Ctha_0452 n=1 Tax=Chloroherpeton thalassium (strain ATCC 35110 / GB-78) TaxID=517418 RepID=Y452_CHLT3|nr:DUF134 domain-containing protein [Chloroherpeton thalassium]B3QUL7.1 RecName: Full=UPF0251 protein Ctha_0452 [Chloroherpeton thalassium ATCC 35110]ACF12923.1 protein of unknown function DUF134 [Chloroherpeton thalassium ATCC 35110]
MPRPFQIRKVTRLPKCKSFKPVGVPRKVLEQAILALDEYEAIRLADYLKLEHLEAAEKMGISRPTFTRLIERARTKLASAIIEAKELVIEGGHIDLQSTRLRCSDCGEEQQAEPSESSQNCPECGSENVEDMKLFFTGAKHGRQRRRRGRA